MEIDAELAEETVGVLGVTGTAAAMKVAEEPYGLKPSEFIARMANM